MTQLLAPHQKRDREADALLAGLSIPQLIAGYDRGVAQLALIEGLEATEDFEIGHPGRHASKAYENWSGQDYNYRRAMLKSAINDTRQELLRRGVNLAEQRKVTF